MVLKIKDNIQHLSDADIKTNLIHSYVILNLFQDLSKNRNLSINLKTKNNTQRWSDPEPSSG